MTKKTSEERRAAHRRYEQRAVSVEAATGQELTLCKSISLEVLGSKVSALYAGPIRGKQVFVKSYDPMDQTVEEIAVREGGLELIPGGLGYRTTSPPIIRKVPLSKHRHGEETVEYFERGGRA